MVVVGFVQVKTAVVGKTVTVGVALFSETITLAVAVQPLVIPVTT